MTWSIRRRWWRHGDRLDRLVEAALDASPGLVRGYTFTARDLRTDMRYALLGVLPLLSGRCTRTALSTSALDEDAPSADVAGPDLAGLVEDPRTRFAAAALQAAALRPGRDMNPIVVYGAPGAGKTTVLDACRRHVEERGQRVAVVQAADLKRVVVGAPSDHADHRRLRQLLSPDFLLVDDIDDLAAFPASSRDVLEILTATIALGQQVVVTATSRERAPLRTWAGSHERALVTDLGEGSGVTVAGAPPA